MFTRIHQKICVSPNMSGHTSSKKFRDAIQPLALFSCPAAIIAGLSTSPTDGVQLHWLL